MPDAVWYGTCPAPPPDKLVAVVAEVAVVAVVAEVAVVADPTLNALCAVHAGDPVPAEVNTCPDVPTDVNAYAVPLPTATAPAGGIVVLPVPPLAIVVGTGDMIPVDPSRIKDILLLRCFLIHYHY